MNEFKVGDRVRVLSDALLCDYDNNDKRTVVQHSSVKSAVGLIVEDGKVEVR